MFIINILSIFIIIEKVASDIDLKGECDVIKIYENYENFPGWSSCLSLKNGINECGEAIKEASDEKSMWTPLSAYKMIEAKEQWDEWNQCNVTCGEGFQTRKLMSSEKCNATQSQSCWVGKCSSNENATLEIASKPVGNHCLNLMRKAQEEYIYQRTAADTTCSVGLELTHLGSLKVTKALQAKSQVNENGCKSNATAECKKAVLNFIVFITDKVDDRKLRSCYDPTRISPGYYESFYQAIESQDPKSKFYHPYTEAFISSCKH